MSLLKVVILRLVCDASLGKLFQPHEARKKGVLVGTSSTQWHSIKNSFNIVDIDDKYKNHFKMKNQVARDGGAKTRNKLE